VDPYGTFAFDRTADFIEAGYRAAHEALQLRAGTEARRHGGTAMRTGAR